MNDVKTTILSSVQDLEDWREVAIPAMAARAAGLPVAKDCPQNRCLTYIVSELRARLAKSEQPANPDHK